MSIAIQHTPILKDHHRSLDGEGIDFTADLIETQHQALFTSIGQHLIANIVLHLDQDFISLLLGESARANFIDEQRFQIHFVV